MLGFLDACFTRDTPCTYAFARDAIDGDRDRDGNNIADRAYVLENGRITLSGAAREMLTNPEIKRMYLGG